MRYVVLILATAALSACPKLPPPDNCTSGTYRCSAFGIPQYCSPSRRWTNSDRQCSELEHELSEPVVCCPAYWSEYAGGVVISACVAQSMCVSTPHSEVRDGGTD